MLDEVIPVIAVALSIRLGRGLETVGRVSVSRVSVGRVSRIAVPWGRVRIHTIRTVSGKRQTKYTADPTGDVVTIEQQGNVSLELSRQRSGSAASELGVAAHPVAKVTSPESQPARR